SCAPASFEPPGVGGGSMSKPPGVGGGSMIVRPPKRHRSLWRRLRRATRGPRNAALAGVIGALVRLIGAFPVPVALAIGRALGAGAHLLLAAPRRLALTHVGMAFPELDLAAR